MKTRKMRSIRFAVSCFLITAVASSLAIVIAVSSNAPKAFAMPLTPPTPVATSTAEVSAYVTPGVLSMNVDHLSGPDSIALNNSDQQVYFHLFTDVLDNSGSGAGWNLTASMTQFDNGGHTLDTGAVTVTASSENNCRSDSCTGPTTNVDYPLAVPSDGSSTTKFFNADVNTGMGAFIIDSTFLVNIPAIAYAGTYNSTMTISITSGP